MAGSKKSIKIGVIAEEYNDVDVLYEYTAKIIGVNSFSFVRFVGHGCGALRRKCRAWAENLVRRGCECIVIMHDSDGGDEGELRQELEKQIKELGVDCWIVLIPIEEVEAWLLADPDAIKKVFNMQKLPRVSRRPETIKNPKEHLGRIVEKGSKSHYLNTIHNRKIAVEQAISTLDRCPSFGQYPLFLAQAGGQG
jgi:hypothetical protein